MGRGVHTWKTAPQPCGMLTLEWATQILHQLCLCSSTQRWPSPLAPKHPHFWLFLQELPLPVLRGAVQRASAPQQREEG